MSKVKFVNTLFIILVFFFSIVLTASSEARQSPADLEPPHGTLRIGMFPFEPINFVDENGEEKGFYPALLAEISRIEGWELEYVSGSWSEGLERLQNHEIDLMISVAFSEERAKIMDYTHESALELWGQVFVNSDQKGINISDLAGKQVGVMRRDISGKNFIKTAKELGISFTIKEYPHFSDVFTAVKNREVEAGVAPQHFGLRHAHEYELIPSSIQFSPFSIYFTAKKGQHHSFLSIIDSYLFRWKSQKNSFYYQQLSKWLGTGMQKELPIWFAPVLSAVLLIVLLSASLALLFKKQVHKATTGLTEANQELQQKNIALKEGIEQLEKTEFDLRSSEQRYAGLYHQFETLLDAISDPLVLLTPERKPLWRNKAFEEVAKKFGDDEGLKLFDLDPKLKGSPVSQCLKFGRVVEDLATTPDGSKWGIKVFPLIDGDQKVSQVIVIAVDITEKVRLRKEAEHTSRLASLGEIAAGIAHEINNPNSVILLNTPIIRDAFADAEEIFSEYYEQHNDLSLAGIDYQEVKHELPQLIDGIHKSSERIKLIVEDLKNFVRDEGLQDLAEISLNDVVDTAVRLLENNIKQSTSNFSRQLKDGLPPAKGNFQKLEQVVINLIQNACQALTENNQRVEVSTDFLPDNNQLLLRVTDTGCGIDPELLDRLTDPFFTTKRKNGGTGLGLSVSERILREHGAQLQIESEPGHGSSFSVILPAASRGML